MQKSETNSGFHGIGTAIRTRPESQCLLYAGFFVIDFWLLKLLQMVKNLHSNKIIIKKKNVMKIAFKPIMHLDVLWALEEEEKYILFDKQLKL